MEKGGITSRLLIFTLLVISFLVLTSTAKADVGCVSNDTVYGCGNVTTEDCTMNGNLFCEEDIFIVGADNIVMDGNGYQIKSRSGHGIKNIGYDGIIIENFRIKHHFDGVSVIFHGIYFENASGGQILNNSIDTVANPSHGIWFHDDSSQNTVIGNDIMTTGYGAAAIKLSSFSDENTIQDNYLKDTGDGGFGIYLANYADSNVISNNIIDTYSDGIYCYNWANNNLIGDNLIRTHETLDHGIYFHSCGNNIIKDTVIDSEMAVDIFIRGAGVNDLVNSTFNKSNIDFDPGATGGINVKWYMDVFVRNLTGSPAEYANVKAWDTFANLIVNEMTGSDGFIDRQTLTEYYQDITGKTYFTEYEVNATKGLLSSQTEMVDLTENFIDDNKVVLILEGPRFKKKIIEGIKSLESTGG